jgi:hypothetical protein
VSWRRPCARLSARRRGAKLAAARCGAAAQRSALTSDPDARRARTAIDRLSTVKKGYWPPLIVPRLHIMHTQYAHIY